MINSNQLWSSDPDKLASRNDQPVAAQVPFKPSDPQRGHSSVQITTWYRAKLVNGWKDSVQEIQMDGRLPIFLKIVVKLVKWQNIQSGSNSHRDLKTQTRLPEKRKSLTKEMENSIALTHKNHGLLKSNGQNHFFFTYWDTQGVKNGRREYRKDQTIQLDQILQTLTSKLK